MPSMKQENSNSVAKFNFDKMTRRQLWVFLLLLVTAPRAAVTAWKQFKAGSALRAAGMVGYKGKSILEAGYFYCPYIPLQTTMMVNLMHTDTQRPRFKIRYGTVSNHGPLYRKVKIG